MLFSVKNERYGRQWDENGMKRTDSDLHRQAGSLLTERKNDAFDLQGISRLWAERADESC